MALSKAAQKQLLSLLKLEQTDIDSIVDVKEEKDFKVPENILIWTKDEQKALKDNITKTANENALEIGIKELKKRASLDFEGKDPDKLIEAFKSKVLDEANINVDTKVAELTKDKEKLQRKLQEREADIEKFKNDFHSSQKENKLRSLLPKEKSDFLTDEQYLTLMKQEYEFIEDNGKQLVKRKDGTILKDKVENELDWSSAINEHFKGTKGWIMDNTEPLKPMGRGTSSSNVSAPQFTKMSEITNYVREQNGGKLMGLKATEQVNQLVQQAVAKNPSFDLKG